MNRGDKITTIYNAYVNDLFTYGLYLGFNKESVKDAIHDVFLKLSTNNNLLDNAENIKFYLFRSLKNRLIDTHKNRKEHVTLEAMNSILELPFNMTVNVETLLIEQEEKLQIKKEIVQMLDFLTPRQREIIYLRYIHEYDYKQISELLQISVHGCRKLVSKAILNLREKFDPKR
ncbi:MAG: sigma-70 family RNA polymerase sigma factor [Bacteroidota bacterium]|nr:sigma-70 family RNA polymerase sigma factor [Bacteroidota bacterium]